MSPSPLATKALDPRAPSSRFDIVAGLVAAAVVLPKAMAYTTVAGLPVAVGLYTAFTPMVIYALLGSSRVLSVSSTTTLAILTSTQLGLVVPDGDPAKLMTATAALTALVGAMLVVARLMRLGFVANFMSTPVLTGFKAGIGLVIVLDQVPKLLGIHITKEGFVRDLFGIAQHLPTTSLITLAVAAATFAILIGMERLKPHSPAPLVAVGGAIAASWLFGLEARGVSTVGLIPRGFPAITVPDISLFYQLLPGALGIALMSFTETIAASRAFAGPADPPVNANRELVATGFANLGGALLGAMPAGGGTSQTAVVRSAGGQSQKASLVTAGTAVATMLLLAPILGLMPNATLAAVVIVYSVGLIQPAEFRAIRSVRSMEFRWAVFACAGVLAFGTLTGNRCRDHRVDDRPGQPERESAGVRHRPQARGGRAAAAVARIPGRRDIRGPIDPAAGGALVLPECPGSGRPDLRPGLSVQAARAGSGHEPCTRSRILGTAGLDPAREEHDGKRRCVLAGRPEPRGPGDRTEHRAERAARSRTDAVQRTRRDSALPGAAGRRGGVAHRFLSGGHEK